VIVILVIRFVPKDWKGLEWKVFDPVVVCGQQSLACSASACSCPLSDIRTADEFGLAVRADFRQRRRHRDHDDRGLLYLLVEAAGQAAAESAGAGQGRLIGDGRSRTRLPRPADPTFPAPNFGSCREVC